MRRLRRKNKELEFKEMDDEIEAPDEGKEVLLIYMQFESIDDPRKKYYVKTSTSDYSILLVNDKFEELIEKFAEFVSMDAGAPVRGEFITEQEYYKRIQEQENQMLSL